MPHMKHVFSSHIDAIGYDDASGELHVRYQTGKTAVYKGVPPGVAQQAQTAPSIGLAMNALVRGRFDHRYLEG